MKKCVVLLVLLLCALLLCSCGKASDKYNKTSEIESTVIIANSEEDISSETESAPAQSGADAATTVPKTASGTNSADVTSSGDGGASSPSVSGGDNQVSGSSGESADSSFFADEYELPFIPK